MQIIILLALLNERPKAVLTSNRMELEVISEALKNCYKDVTDICLKD
jgi:ribonuclease HI